jgi:hypothetical protein
MHAVFCLSLYGFRKKIELTVNSCAATCPNAP